MATIIIEGAVHIEWNNVSKDVAKAIETLLHSIEENLETDMISHVSDLK